LHYAEYPASPELAGIVRCVWVFEADWGTTPHDENITPDGSPELIAHFGNPYREQNGKRWQPQPPLLLAGNLTRPLALRAVGKVGVLGIRLWPHAVSRFVSVPAIATLDQRTPLSPRGGMAKWRKQLTEARDDQGRLALVPELVAALSLNEAAPDPAAAWACAEIFASRGQASPEALAAGVGLSLRQLERRMHAASGLSLKKLASLVRFRAVFDELNAEIPSPWLSAALAAGYFDQAHMIRDFKRYAGKAPRAFLSGAGALSSALISLPAK